MRDLIFLCRVLRFCVFALYGRISNSRPLLHVFITFLYFTYDLRHVWDCTLYFYLGYHVGGPEALVRRKFIKM